MISIVATCIICPSALACSGLCPPPSVPPFTFTVILFTPPPSPFNSTGILLLFPSGTTASVPWSVAAYPESGPIAIPPLANERYPGDDIIPPDLPPILALTIASILVCNPALIGSMLTGTCGVAKSPANALNIAIFIVIAAISASIWIVIFLKASANVVVPFATSTNAFANPSTSEVPMLTDNPSINFICISVTAKWALNFCKSAIASGLVNPNSSWVSAICCSVIGFDSPNMWATPKAPVVSCLVLSKFSSPCLLVNSIVLVAFTWFIKTFSCSFIISNEAVNVSSMSCCPARRSSSSIDCVIVICNWWSCNLFSLSAILVCLVNCAEIALLSFKIELFKVLFSAVAKFILFCLSIFFAKTSSITWLRDSISSKFAIRSSNFCFWFALPASAGPTKFVSSLVSASIPPKSAISFSSIFLVSLAACWLAVKATLIFPPTLLGANFPTNPTIEDCKVFCAWAKPAALAVNLLYSSLKSLNSCIAIVNPPWSLFLIASLIAWILSLSSGVALFSSLSNCSKNAVACSLTKSPFSASPETSVILKICWPTSNPKNLPIPPIIPVPCPRSNTSPNASFVNDIDKAFKSDSSTLNASSSNLIDLSAFESCVKLDTANLEFFSMCSNWPLICSSLSTEVFNASIDSLYSLKPSSPIISLRAPDFTKSNPITAILAIIKALKAVLTILFKLIDLCALFSSEVITACSVSSTSSRFFCSALCTSSTCFPCNLLFAAAIRSSEFI